MCPHAYVFGCIEADLICMHSDIWMLPMITFMLFSEHRIRSNERGPC
jgi:hypothetical protein